MTALTERDPTGVTAPAAFGSSRSVSASLAELEQVIESNLGAVFKLGAAFFRIRDEEKYREAGFDGFVEYLDSKPWGIGQRTAYQYIDAYRVCAIAQTSMPETHARELAPLLKKSTPEVVRQVYAEVIDEAGSPLKVTAVAIRVKVREIQPPKPPTLDESVHGKIIEHLDAIINLGKRWDPGMMDRLPQSTCRKQNRKVEEVGRLLSTMSKAYLPRIQSLPTAPKGVRRP